MKLQITPYLDSSYNCLDVLILTLARNWGCEHRLMFANSWRFRYDRAPDETTSLSFDDVLDVKELVENRNIEAALSEHHGLVIHRTEMADAEHAIALAKEELQQGYPVALGVDAFHCHWSSAYQKYHLGHYCLAVGLDDDEQRLLVIDPYLSMDMLSLPVSDYAQTLKDETYQKDCLTFRLTPQEGVAPDWRKILDRAASTMLDADGGSKFEQMRDFASDIAKHLDFNHEVARHPDPYASFLVLYFKTFSFSRLNFAECLAHLGQATGQDEIVKAAARMKEQGNNIYKMFLLLMKMSLTPARFKASEFARRLLEVADREEALARDLASMTKTQVAAQTTVTAEAR